MDILGNMKIWILFYEIVRNFNGLHGDHTYLEIESVIDEGRCIMFKYGHSFAILDEYGCFINNRYYDPEKVALIWEALIQENAKWTAIYAEREKAEERSRAFLEAQIIP